MLLDWQYVKEPGFHMACIHLYLHVEALIFDKEYPVIMILQKKNWIQALQDIENQNLISETFQSFNYLQRKTLNDSKPRKENSKKALQATILASGQTDKGNPEFHNFIPLWNML